MPYRVNAPEAIHQTIEGEVILINLATGSYYSLRDSAAEIWALLESGLDPAEAARRLGVRYEADDGELREHVDHLVERLREEGLIAETEEGPDPASVPHSEAPPAEQFVPPVLEKFDDMQDLILLDPVHEVDAREGWPHAPDE